MSDMFDVAVMIDDQASTVSLVGYCSYVVIASEHLLALINSSLINHGMFIFVFDLCACIAMRKISL